jgi:hypothetical protein
MSEKPDKKIIDLVVLQQEQLDSHQKQIKILTNMVEILEVEVEELKIKI